MKSIRRNTFETNSSSSHSISLTNDYEEYQYQLVSDYTDDYIDDNTLSVDLGEYGWAWHTYIEPTDKLKYLLTQLAQMLGCNSWCDHLPYEEETENKETIYESEEFKNIEEAIVRNTRYKKLVIGSLEGYVDHQSAQSPQSCLDEVGGISYEEFIFNPNIKIRTGNDNSRDPEDDSVCWWSTSRYGK